MMARRFLALGSLVLLVASVVLAVALAITTFPRGLSVLLCLVIAAIAAWHAVRHRGFARVILAVFAAAFVLGTIAFVVFEGSFLLNVLVIVLFVISLACARSAFAVHVNLPRAE